MPRAGLGQQVGVVAGASIFVAKNDGDGRSCGFAFEYAGEQLRRIGFNPGRSAARSAFAALQIGGKVGRLQANACRTAVNANAYACAVRLSKKANSKFSAKSIHGVILFCGLKLLQKKPKQTCLNFFSFPHPFFIHFKAR
jgi:hypothetical protein